MFSLLTSYFLCLLMRDPNLWHPKANNREPKWWWKHCLGPRETFKKFLPCFFTDYLLCFQQLAMTDYTPSTHHMNIERCNMNREHQDDSGHHWWQPPPHSTPNHCHEQLLMGGNGEQWGWGGWRNGSDESDDNMGKETTTAWCDRQRRCDMMTGGWQ